MASIVHSPVKIASVNAISVRAIAYEEISAVQFLAIRLHRNPRNTLVRSSARIETAVQTPIGIEPGNAVSVRAIHSAESAPNDHFAIRLNGHRRNGIS